MVDPTLGKESAGEGAEDLELDPKLPSEGGKDKDLSDDPLDAIQDPEVRAEAKKHRAIGRRVDKGESPIEEPKPKADAPKQEFLTKADFHRTNERKAVREAVANPEVKANWDKIVPFYTPRRGKESPEDILEDIKDAITLYNARNPVVEKDDSARDLSVTPVAKSGGGEGGGKTPPKVVAPPNFKLPVPPKEWYQKKKES